MDPQDLELRITRKRQELDDRIQALDRYAKTCGRDRWYNRGCHDITTLRAELAELVAMRQDQVVDQGSL